MPSEKTFPLMLKAGFFWTFEGDPFERRDTCPAKGRYPDASFGHIFFMELGRPVEVNLNRKGIIFLYRYLPFKYVPPQGEMRDKTRLKNENQTISHIFGQARVNGVCVRGNSLF